MRLIVTGASGFIGHNVLLRAPRSWEIVAVYHRTPGLESFIARHRLDHVRAVACDLLDEQAVRRLFAEAGRADACLYLAANSDPAASPERPRWDLESNTIALVNFLEHCAPDHLVYVSSGAVYDGLKGEVTPATPVAPLLPYAISKLASEQYVRYFCARRHALASFINVRFFGAYGPYEALRKITTRWLNALAAGQREFVLRGDGNNYIDFMYVDDAVDAFLRLVQARGERITVDLASGAPVTINQIVETMARALGVAVSIRHQTLRDRFGFAPTISFEDGLGRLAAFFEAERRAAGHEA
jgi:nucleoside-diphosphate-sugar epimerase